MMNNPKENKRKYERFDTEVKIFFQVNYDIKTIIKFQVIEEFHGKARAEKYSALSKNISAEGVCFVSQEELREGTMLDLEIYLPKASVPVLMVGQVRWSRKFLSEGKVVGCFETGVKVLTVNEKSIGSSIYYDDKNKVVWSAVLESVLGNFRVFAQGRNKV